MNPSRFKVAFSVVIALCTLSARANAQYGGARQRQDYPQNIGITGPPPVPPPLAALAIMHAAELGLADSQRVAIEAIRQVQDSTNRPWMMRLDSLRPTRQPAGGPNDLSQEQREEIAARKAAITQVMDGMRETNAVARQKAMALLDEKQQKRAAELEEDARKKAEEDGKRGMRGNYGGDAGRRGGGMGRPPAG